MIHREKVKDWRGKIIGFIDEDSTTGDRIVRDFYGRILGKYIKKLNLTRDFYGRQIARGDRLLMLLNTEANK